MTGSVTCSARIETERAPSYPKAALWGAVAVLMVLLLVADVAILKDATIVDVLLFAAVALWAYRKVREHLSPTAMVVCLCEVSRDDEGLTIIFRNAEWGHDVSLCAGNVLGVSKDDDTIHVTLGDVERCVWEDAETCLSHEDVDQMAVDLDVSPSDRDRVMDLLISV